MRSHRRSPRHNSEGYVTTQDKSTLTNVAGTGCAATLDTEHQLAAVEAEQFTDETAQSFV